MKQWQNDLIKCVLIICNLIFEYSGIAIIFVGAVELSGEHNSKNFVDSICLASAVVWIVLGAIKFAVAFFGCFAAFRESYQLLILFSLSLPITFLIEVIIGIGTVAYINDALTTVFFSSMERYSENDETKHEWDNLQIMLLCCGVEDPNDWHGHQLPPTCCYDNKILQPVDYCFGLTREKYLHENGCYEQLKRKFINKTNIIIGFITVTAFVEVVAIISACCLIYSIKKIQKQVVIVNNYSDDPRSAQICVNSYF